MAPSRPNKQAQVVQCAELQRRACMQIMRGVHENMLEVPYMDQDLARTAAMCDWLCDFDACNTRIFRKQHFSLMPLLHVCTLAAANLCQSALHDLGYILSLIHI